MIICLLVLIVSILVIEIINSYLSVVIIERLNNIERQERVLKERVAAVYKVVDSWEDDLK